MKKSLPIGVLFGCFVGGFVYRYLLSDWFVTAAITALYSGIGYFLLAYDISLLGDTNSSVSTTIRQTRQTSSLWSEYRSVALIEYVISTA